MPVRYTFTPSPWESIESGNPVADAPPEDMVVLASTEAVVRVSKDRVVRGTVGEVVTGSE